MAGYTSRRWSAVILAVAAAATLTLAACGKQNAGSISPNASASGGQAGNVPASGEADGGVGGGSTATSGTGGGGGTGTGGGTQAPTYPSDAKTYGLEFLKAWGAKNNSRMVQLSSSNTASYVTSQYGNPNAQWTNYNCVPDPTYATCTYINATGDTTRVMVQNLVLGKPNAISSVTYERTDIPKDAPGYAQNFTSAWGTGPGAQSNFALMFVYSNATVVSQISGLSKYPNGTQAQPAAPCPGAASKTCVEMYALPIGSRKSIYFIMDMSKVSQGKPGGITGFTEATS
jgi:hypothetical protein